LHASELITWSPDGQRIVAADSNNMAHIFFFYPGRGWSSVSAQADLLPLPAQDRKRKLLRLPEPLPARQALFPLR
jgi:hypothetical protein